MRIPALEVNSHVIRSNNREFATSIDSLSPSALLFVTEQSTHHASSPVVLRNSKPLPDLKNHGGNEDWRAVCGKEHLNAENGMRRVTIILQIASGKIHHAVKKDGKLKNQEANWLIF